MHADILWQTERAANPGKLTPTVSIRSRLLEAFHNGHLRKGSRYSKSPGLDIEEGRAIGPLPFFAVEPSKMSAFLSPFDSLRDFWRLHYCNKLSLSKITPDSEAYAPTA
jgi:hypothetical protein